MEPGLKDEIAGKGERPPSCFAENRIAEHAQAHFLARGVWDYRSVSRGRQLARAATLSLASEGRYGVLGNGTSPSTSAI